MSPSLASRRAFLAAAGGTLAAGCLDAVPSGQSNQPNRESPPLDTPAPDGSWSQVGRAASRRGYNPTVTLAEPAAAWTTDVHGVVTTPTVVGDTIYVTRGDPEGDDVPVATVEAYALDDGSRQWSRSLETDFRYHGGASNHRPIYYRGSLFLNVGSGVRALDAATGDPYWTTDLKVRSDPPTVSDDGVFITGESALHCLGHDGSKQWQASPEASDDTHSGWGTFLSPPAVSDEAVYLSVDRLLVALSPVDGSERWRTSTAGPMQGLARAADTLVSTGGGVWAFGLDGTRRWGTHIDENTGTRSAVTDDTVYVAGANGLVAAYDLASGDERWRTRVGSDEYAPGTIPVAVDSGVAVLDVEPRAESGGQVTVHGLAADSGTVEWTRSRHGGRGRGPIAASGHFVATTQPLPGGDEFGSERPTIRSGGGDVTSTLWALRSTV